MMEVESNGEYVVEEVLYSGQSTTISRVRHNDKTVILKSNSKLLTHPRKLRKYFQEFIIGSSIQSTFVVHYVEFKKFDYGYALVMEDIGGTVLTKLFDYKNKPLPLDTFLDIACKITKGLGAVHAAGVIHKDINPSNIVYCETTGELNIIDFGISSQLPKNEVSPTAIPHETTPEKTDDETGTGMEGTLMYMSPEQTGRMNRVVDYRSDFYSLGVTFYELLGGAPPFVQSGNHPHFDLVYKHLAVHPKSLLEARPEVGSALWSVVSKLMAKNAEDRYQDFKGLLYDLREIERAYKEGKHEEMPDFVAGSHDLATRLQVSQKLYGRDEEIKKLTTNFENVCSRGNVSSMLMLVHGYSGVGKTLLVNEVHKLLAKHYGNYVTGKFEQFIAASPYSALISALNQLIQQILTENETSLAMWRGRLEEGLQGNGKLIVELIPDLELVIGPQPEVPVLEPVANIRRFTDTLTSFIFSLAFREHPLVIFLDDLQWADTNTLNLMVALLTSTEAHHTRYLLLVGAYRDNEVSASHSLSLTLSEIQIKGGLVENVYVSPLDENQVIQLLHDTFNLNQNSKYKLDVEPLGKLVYKKTQGNPFFVNQLLTTLHKNGHIRFVTECEVEDPEMPVSGGWQYDMDAIQKEDYTSNVVDLMVSMLRKLPQPVQHLIGIAATIGSQVEHWLLAVAALMSEHETTTTLNSAVSEGYLIPNSDEYVRTAQNSDALNQIIWPEFPSPPHLVYRFAHDRVQQAAVELITQEEGKIIHGRIAENLLTRAEKENEDLSNYLLKIVTHMNQSFDESNLSYELDDASGQKAYIFPFTAVFIAEINYKAAIKAKNANAFQQALSYANLGVTLLARDEQKAWEKYQILSFATHKLCLELQVLTGNYEAADATYALLVPHATSVQAKTDLYITMFHRFELEHKLAEATDAIANALSLYEFRLPMDAQIQERAFLDDISLVDKKLESFKNLQELMDFPECSDAIQRNVIKLLMTVWPVAYMLGRRFLAAFISSQVALRSMEHGVCPETGMALVAYVWFSGPITHEYIKLNELSKAGLSMLELRYPHRKALRGSASLLYAIGVSAWCYPLIKSLPYIEVAFELNSQAGNLSFMTFAAVYIVEIPFMCGLQLAKPALEYEKKQSFWKEGNFGLYPFLEAIAQPIWDLQGVQKDFLQGQKYEDSVYPKEPFLNTGYNYARLVSSFFLRNDMGKWLQYADESAASIPINFMGIYKVAEMETVVSLLYLDWLSRSPVAREIFAKHAMGIYGLESSENDKDIESEAGQMRELKEIILRKRIKMIKSSIESLSKAAFTCRANFEHKLLLLKAEAARVSLMLHSDAIFSEEEISSPRGQSPTISVSPIPSPSHSRAPSPSALHSPRNNASNFRQGFEDTIELYESAIESARSHGFMQYEALGLELYGRFWLSTRKSRPRIALLFLTEAILAYERWGATEKARLLSDECAQLTRSDPTTTLYTMDAVPQKKTSTSVSSLDLEMIVQASQTICNEADIANLTIKMVKTIVENASAERGTFFVVDENYENKEESFNSSGYRDTLLITAEFDYQQIVQQPQQQQQLRGSCSLAESGVVLLDPKLPLSQWANGPISLVRLVGRTYKAVVLKCAHEDSQFGSDEYISAKKVKSVICMPILLNKVLKGVMYLENNLCEGMYTKSRVDLLNVLTSQMAISLENIRFLHEQIREQSEKMRYEQLQREESIQRERADAAEKYKVQLENFIDMICHEIRNPLNGIFGNTDLILHYLNTYEAAYQRRQAWANLTPSVLIGPNDPPSFPSVAHFFPPTSRSIPSSPAPSIPSSPAPSIPSSPNPSVSASPSSSTPSSPTQVFPAHPFFPPPSVSNPSSPTQQISTALLSTAPPLSTSASYPSSPSPLSSTPPSFPFPPFVGGREGKEKEGETFESFVQQVRLCAATIQSCAEHQKRMTDDVLQLSRLRSHKLVVVNTYYRPWDMVQTALHVFGVQADRKGLELKFQTERVYERTEIYGDSVRTYQILSNIVSNAIKFTLQGSITIIAIIQDGESEDDLKSSSSSVQGESQKEEPKKDTIPCEFTLRVIDTGIGMNAKEQSRIFQRFSQANNRTSKEYGGSGLGLSICKKLAKLMNGTISVESEKRKGSTFTLRLTTKRVLEASLSQLSVSGSDTFGPLETFSDTTLPKAIADRSVAQGEELGEGAKKDTKRILIAEDNLMNQTLLSRVLSLKGYAVEIASNGEEAVAKYKENQKNEGERYYSVILMDIQMPVMDGLQATELIRNFEAENQIAPVKIIGLSGNARDEYHQTALASGMNEYITKPYHKEVLYAVLEKQ